MTSYRRVGVGELLRVDPVTTAFEVHVPDGEAWQLVEPGADGWVALRVMDVWPRAGAGGGLGVRTTEGVTTL